LPATSITATRAPLVTRALPATVTVFDRASLREAGITHLTDVLRLVPGALVLSNGSFGSQTSLFFRGGESDYVQVLVDGVPMNAPGGFYNFGPLTIDNVDRIEVVRGAGSLLYGSDAVSGVIQIFTRTGAGRPRINALVGGGSHGGQRYELGASGGRPRASWSLSGTHHRSEGIYRFNSDYDNQVLSGALKLRGERADAAFTTRLSDYTLHYPTNSAGEVVDSNARNSEERAVASAEIGVKVVPRLELRARAAANYHEPRTRDAKDSPGDPDVFNADAAVRRNVYELRAIGHVASGHVLTLSAERANDREESSSHSESSFGPFDSEFTARRENTAIVAQLLGNPGARSTYVLGVRRDDNSAFGDFTTARAGVAVRVSRGTTLRGSVANAFKAPTFFENFATGFVVGNPDLTPERTRTVELGVQHVSPRGRVSVGATAFAQRFTDLIQYSGSAPQGEPNYQNLAAASADGLELEGVARVRQGVTARASYTYLKTKVTDAGADEGASATFVEGDRLLRRPTHFATFTLSQVTPRGSSTITVTHSGDRDDRDFNQFPEPAVIVMKGFTTVDFASVTALGGGLGASRFSFIARVENVLNRRYQQTYGFASPGRTLFVGLRLGD
jgi:vitamin B12 transporter